MKTKSKIYLLCDEFTVQGVISRNPEDKFWEQPEFTEVQVLEWSGEGEDPWPVGTRLPLYENYRFRVIKTLGPVRPVTLETDWESYHKQSVEQVRQRDFLFERFLTNLTPERLKEISTRFERLIAKENVVLWSAERNYRVYRARSYSFEIATLLLRLVGEDRTIEKISDLFATMATVQFSSLHLQLLKSVNRTRYTDYQNDNLAWDRDQQVLLSTFWVFKETFRELAKFAEERLQGRSTPETLERVQTLWLPTLSLDPKVG